MQTNGITTANVTIIVGSWHQEPKEFIYFGISSMLSLSHSPTLSVCATIAIESFLFVGCLLFLLSVALVYKDSRSSAYLEKYFGDHTPYKIS